MNKNALLFLAIHAKGGVKDLKLKIIGSGGMSIIPSSFCKCKICEEARRKGGRYERLGPSLYIDDIKMLIDTPEDIAVACNRQRISEVKHLSISHSDPDHVRGIRIVEKIGCDFIKGTSMPIGFYALPEVIRDINQMNRDCFKYYGDVLHCISVNETPHIKIDNSNFPHQKWDSHFEKSILWLIKYFHAAISFRSRACCIYWGRR